jgi:hypothetical protein
MKLGLHKYAVVIPIENSRIKFNNKLNSLQGMKLHRITELCKEWFSVCLYITFKYCTIATFKISVKENNDSNKACRHVSDVPLYKTMSDSNGA